MYLLYGKNRHDEHIIKGNLKMDPFFSRVNVFKTRKEKPCQRNMSRFIGVLNPWDHFHCKDYKKIDNYMVITFCKKDNQTLGFKWRADCLQREQTVFLCCHYFLLPESLYIFLYLSGTTRLWLFSSARCEVLRKTDRFTLYAQEEGLEHKSWTNCWKD